LNTIQENKILVSVLIPVFNMQSSIKESVMSILNQTYQNFELLIVDDGSTDDTWNVLQEIKNSKIKLFRFEENKGRPFARNFLLNNAQGQYIAWLDADDFAYVNRIEKQLACFKANNDIVGVCSFVDLCTESKCFTKTVVKNTKLLKAQLLFKSPIVFSAIMHKNIKELFFDNTLLRSQDTSFLWKLSFYGGIDCINESLVKHNLTINHRKVYENSLIYVKQFLSNTIQLPTNFPIDNFVVILREPKELTAKQISITLSSFKKLLPIIKKQFPELITGVKAVFVYEVVKCSYLHSIKNLRYLIFANPLWVYQLYKSKY